jgi:hypothetical protein
MTVMRRSPVILLAALVTLTTACESKLPHSAQALLVQRLHAQKLVRINDLRRRTIDGFDYLGVFGTFEITWGFESWYHPQVILRKRHSDADWSGAELFFGAGSLDYLFTLSDAEFTKALQPWPRKDLTKRSSRRRAGVMISFVMTSLPYPAATRALARGGSSLSRRC